MSHLPPLTPVHHQSRRPLPPLTRPRQPPTHEREFKKCRRTGGLHLLLMSKNSFFVPFLQKIPFLHMRHVVNERYSEKSHTTNSIKSPHDPLGTLQRKKRETRCPFSQLGGGGGLLRFVRDFFRCARSREIPKRASSVSSTFRNSLPRPLLPLRQQDQEERDAALLSFALILIARPRTKERREKRPKRCTKRGEVVFNGVFYFCFFVLFFRACHVLGAFRMVFLWLCNRYLCVFEYACLL